MRYSHFAHIDDPGQFRRKLTREQAERVARLREERGMSWCSIASWFTRNGVPVSTKAVRNAYRWTAA